MELGLKSKVAVVTGASKGIGLAVTKALVAEGARVIAGARDVGSELRSLAEGGAVDAVSIDLATPGGPQALVAEAQKYGGLDIVVNNVGAVALRLEGFASVTDDQWLSSFNLNSDGYAVESRRRRAGTGLSARLGASRAGRRRITLGEEGVQLRYYRGPLADCRPHSLHRATTYVANGEDPLDPGLQRERRSLS